jgi:hypothetical protein
MPLAWKPALSARHSSVQALAVFACAQAWEDTAPTPITRAHANIESGFFIFHPRNIGESQRIPHTAIDISQPGFAQS